MNKKDFAAIDFETANECRSSVCSVGVVIVRNGRIADKFYSLIRPLPDYYSYWNTQVHGLTADSTRTAPVFPEVWTHVSSLIGDLPLVAHNWRFRSKGPQKTDDYFGVKPPKKDSIINKKGRELGSRASIFRSIGTQFS